MLNQLLLKKPILIFCLFIFANLLAKPAKAETTDINKINNSGYYLAISYMPNAKITRQFQFANLIKAEIKDKANPVGINLGYNFNHPLSIFDFKLYLSSTIISIDDTNDEQSNDNDNDNDSDSDNKIQFNYILLNTETILKLNQTGGIALALGLGSGSYQGDVTGVAYRLAVGYSAVLNNGLQLSGFLTQYEEIDLLTNFTTRGLELTIGYVF